MHGERLDSIATSAPHIDYSQTEDNPSAGATAAGAIPTLWSYPTMTIAPEATPGI